MIHEHLAIVARKRAALGGGGYSLLSSATGVYSLNAIEGYAGNVVRVRRTSDSAELDFTATEVTDGTLATWVGGANTGKIARLYDQTGNGNTLNSESATRQAEIMAAGGVLNTRLGSPVIREDSTTDGYDLAATQTIETFALVFELEATGVNYGVLRDSSNTSNDVFVSDTQLSLDGTGTDAGVYALNGATLSSPAENHTWSLSTATRYLLFTDYTTGNLTNVQQVLQLRTGISDFRGWVWCLAYWSADASAEKSDIEGAINAEFSIY